MILKQRVVIGTEPLIRMCWRSIIAGKGVKGAYCKAVPACTSEKGIFPFIQWITVLLKWPFPLRHYRGISVVLDLELVSQNPPGILAESGIGIADFKNKFCADGSCFVMRAKDEIEHIFSELYSVPDRLQKPYFMLKVQELLLFLCMVDVNKEKAARVIYFSPGGDCTGHSQAAYLQLAGTAND